MNLRAITYYCEQCGDHSVGGSCFLHPQRPEEEERNAEEIKAHVIKEWFRSEITKARREEGKESSNGAASLTKDFHELAKKEGKSEVIKQIREWQNNKRQWTDNMPAVFGNQLTAYQAALSDLIDFVNELEGEIPHSNLVNRQGPILPTK